MTSTIRQDVGQWSGEVSNQYMVGKVPSGGYLTTLALQCVTGELLHASNEPPLPNTKRPPNAHRDVLTANVHFMNSTFPGPYVCKVDILKSGRTTSSVQASVYQNNKETMRLLCTCGDLHEAEAKGPNMQHLCNGDHESPPTLPPLRECIRVDAGDNTPQSVRSRVHLMMPQASADRYESCRATKGDGSFDEEVLLKRKAAVQKNARADYSGYIYFADGTEPTLAAAAVYLDASVPPILGAYVTGWVPTMYVVLFFFFHFHFHFFFFFFFLHVI